MEEVTLILFFSHLVNFILGNMEPFIVDGGYAKITQFPYSAFLGIGCVYQPRDEPLSFICGSSIVNQDILLTAAHCLHNCLADSYITVSVGHEIITKGAVATVHSFLLHEKFYDGDTGNDIAIVRVKTRLQFNSSISRVALMKNPPYYEQAFVAGWGFDGKNGHSRKLKSTMQYVWKRNKCLELIKYMPKGAICASSKSGYADRGDSGSALVVRGYIQVGIVSYKDPAYSESVVVYTDTGYHYKWIKKSTIKLMCTV